MQKLHNGYQKQSEYKNTLQDSDSFGTDCKNMEAVYLCMG